MIDDSSWEKYEPFVKRWLASLSTQELEAFLTSNKILPQSNELDLEKIAKEGLEFAFRQLSGQGGD